MAKETITRVPLNRLAESPMNPRRIRDDEADKGLAASIKEQGVLAPLLIRKNGSNGKYEILAGSRRFRAAKAAGLKEVPTIVKDVDDKAALEIIIIENLQRADIHPLDEADGFDELLDQLNGDFGAVSVRVSKPRAYIAKRARVANLTVKWRKVWLDPENTVFGVDHAIHLSRLEQKVQDDIHKDSFGGWRRETPSLVDLVHAITEYHMRVLDKAPWDLKDATLHKKAGSCDACPKRSGSNGDLFSDIKGGNVCTDSGCFGEKLNRQADVEAGKAKGNKMKFKLLSSAHYDPNKKLLGSEGWVRAKAKSKCNFIAVGMMMSGGDKRFGEVFTICLGGQQCKEHRNTESGGGGSVRPKISKTERKKRITKNRNIRRQLEENNVTLDHILLSWKPDLEGMREITETFWGRLWNDNRVRVAMRRGWIQKATELDRWDGKGFKFKRDILPKMSLNEMYALMLEASVVGDLGSQAHTAVGSNVKALAKKWGVIPKRVEQVVDAAEKKRDEARTKLRKEKVEERRKLKAKASKKANKAVRKAVAAKAKKLAKSKSK